MIQLIDLRAFPLALAKKTMIQYTNITFGLELTGENYVLAVSYTGSDEKDRPNLADAMDDWHADYGYDELYFSLNAKTPLN